MNIIDKDIFTIHPYENNPRNNDEAVKYVANSIKEFGFKVPIVIDKDGVIVAGHTRYKAAVKLGLEKVPCIIADDLTPEQVKAFRLADNKTAEMAGWDFDLLGEELLDLDDVNFDMSDFGFLNTETGEDWFEERERNDTSADSEKYQEWLDKFKEKKTTDDCYTPDIVYDAIAEWVEKEYGVKQENFVRPFYPGGDYQNYKYDDEAVVVDNPPFSILAEIVTFYSDNNIKFFLFAPTLTMFNSRITEITSLVVGTPIIYENGANISTSFLTNLGNESVILKSEPNLYQIVKEANEENLKETAREIPQYKYPDCVVSAPMIAKLSKYGVDYEVPKGEAYRITQLEEQKKVGKTIFGSGFLISEKAAAEKAAAEKAAAEKAAAEKAAAEKAAAEKAAAIEWQLSEKEKSIVAMLSK